MAITPGAGYMVDPNNPNAVIPIGSQSTINNPNAGYQFSGGSTPTPAAQQPPVPTPQPTTPPAPTVTINNAPQSQPTQTQSAPQPTAQNALSMPPTGSVVDLLNAAGQKSDYASRQQLAQQYGIQGYQGTAAQNQELSKKFLDAFNAKKSSPVPQTSADARSAMTSYFQDTPQQEDPQKSFFDQYMAMNPVVKTLYDTINNELSHPITQQSFKDEYAKLQTEQGIPQLNADLLNIKNIMDGTEDDIRTEITKAGGFATESQVQALTATRNKVLLKQAKSLQDQLIMKEDYVDRLMDFSKLDRDQVSKDLDRKLGLTEKLADIQDKITSATRDNYKNLVDKIGYDGIAKALQGDPGGQAMAEQFLGLPEGILSNPNAAQFLRPPTEQKPYQFISATKEQAGGVFDPNTGTFTPRGGGGGGSGGGIGGVGGGTTSPISQATKQALTTILASSKFTAQQRADVMNAINNGQDPFIVIKNQAKNIMGQSEATQVQKYEVARDTLASIGKQLAQFYAAGGSTDIFTGNLEKVYNKLGNVHDPKLVNLATQIQGNLQVYRNAISGTAYSAQEGQDIASIFPGINKTEQLNNAILRGRQTLFDDVIDANYRSALGATYDTLKAASTQSTKTPPGTVVTVAGKQYKVGADGDSLEPIAPVSINWSLLKPVTTLKI